MGQECDERGEMSEQTITRAASKGYMTSVGRKQLRYEGEEMCRLYNISSNQWLHEQQWSHFQHAV